MRKPGTLRQKYIYGKKQSMSNNWNYDIGTTKTEGIGYYYIHITNSLIHWNFPTRKEKRC